MGESYDDTAESYANIILPAQFSALCLLVAGCLYDWIRGKKEIRFSASITCRPVPPYDSPYAYRTPAC